MDNLETKNLLNNILTEISTSNGFAAVDKFNNLRSVDAKIREVKMILSSSSSDLLKLSSEIDNDIDFSANSRRVRLEALANYCRTAIRFLESGVIKQKKKIYNSPDLSKLTSVLPDLDNAIQNRWLEAQKCQHIGAYLSSVIMMGSILEALLLARSIKDESIAYTSSKTPKDKKTGKPVPISNWNLNILIDVAVDTGWIKVDRGKFSHALRESRNIVHPWAQVTQKAYFDEATCKTCWHVLNSSVDDLLNSI